MRGWSRRGFLISLIVAVLSALPIAAGSSAEVVYHGNRSSHVFHAPSCRHYECANCTVDFESIEAAVKAGYRPCRVCRPAASVTSPTPQRTEPSPAYVGNVKSRVFHRLTCGYSGCKNCTRQFNSREAAIAAGFRPGGCCDP